MFCPGTWEKADLKAEYLDFWVAANLVNSTHAPESFSLKVAQEEQKCDKPWLWRGKQVKELWILNWKQHPALTAATFWVCIISLSSCFAVYISVTDIFYLKKKNQRFPKKPT